MDQPTGWSSVKVAPKVDSQTALGWYHVDGLGRKQTKIGHCQKENVLSLA